MIQGRTTLHTTITNNLTLPTNPSQYIRQTSTAFNARSRGTWRSRAALLVL